MSFQRLSCSRALFPAFRAIRARRGDDPVVVLQLAIAGSLEIELVERLLRQILGDLLRVAHADEERHQPLAVPEYELGERCGVAAAGSLEELRVLLATVHRGPPIYIDR
jgi:hypothetical protein